MTARVGHGPMTVAIPGHHPIRQAMPHTRLISTRTRKHHFTIALADGCTLAFHRPPGETRHAYVLDTKQTCPSSNARIDIARAKLSLDTDTTLTVTFDGIAAATVHGRGGPDHGNLHVEIRATRR